MAKLNVDWNKLYGKYLASNKSVNAFAKESGISPSAVRQHFKMLETEANSEDSEDFSSFVPVQIYHSESERNACTGADISFHEISIHVTADTDKTLLINLLHILSELC